MGSMYSKSVYHVAVVEEWTVQVQFQFRRQIWASSDEFQLEALPSNFDPAIMMLVLASE
jgi:hypothetical protein